jgi:hypothetical protein
MPGKTTPPAVYPCSDAPIDEPVLVVAALRRSIVA